MRSRASLRGYVITSYSIHYTKLYELPGKFRHFIPVGRLDYASEGVLLLTDSPSVAEKLMTSSLPRTYNIKIDKPVTKEMVEAMEKGLKLEDARAGAHEKSAITSMEFAPFTGFELRHEGKSFTKLRVTISEGKNRAISSCRPPVAPPARPYLKPRP